MLFLIKEEIYKLLHKNSVKFMPIVLLVLMAALGFGFAGREDIRFYVSVGYAGFQWAIIILIIESASIITMEFQYGTIKHLVYERNSRIGIYLAKFIVILLYDVAIHVLVVFFTLIIKYLSLGQSVPFSERYIHGHSLLQNLLSETVVDLLGTLIIISAVFMIASMFNSNAISIALGIGIMFVGQGVSSAVISSLHNSVIGIQWNPFNMLNLANQWGNPDYASITHLNISELTVGNLAYTLLFFVVSMWVFSRKRI